LKDFDGNVKVDPREKVKGGSIPICGEGNKDELKNGKKL